MKDKVLIFIPYQDSDNFLSDGILTREFAMLYMLWEAGYKKVFNIKKPRTWLDKKRYEINNEYYPKGTIENCVKNILEQSETIQYLPVFNIHQLLQRRGWWNYGYQKTINDLSLNSNKNYLVYSDNPFAIDLLEYLSKNGCEVFFDVMDNFAIHPSLNDKERRIALEGYKKVFQFSNIISANSQQTCEYMSAYTEKKIKLIKNGVFLENEAEMGESCKQISEIIKIKKNYRCVVGYIGKLGLRLDDKLIRKVSSRCKDTLFVFVGPYLKGQINKDLIELFNHNNNVLHMEGIPSAYVYTMLNQFDILMIPHSVGKNENGGDPLKLYQYLTRGKLIITTSILGVDEFRDNIVINDSPRAWIDIINSYDNNCLIKLDENVIKRISWHSRFEAVKEVIDELII